MVPINPDRMALRLLRTTRQSRREGHSSDRRTAMCAMAPRSDRRTACCSEEEASSDGY